MMTTMEPEVLANLKNESDRKLAEALLGIQNREDMRFCRNQEIVNGIKAQFNQAYENEPPSPKKTLQ